MHSLTLRKYVLHESSYKWEFSGRILQMITENQTCTSMSDYLKKLKEEEPLEFDYFNEAMAEITNIENNCIVNHLKLLPQSKVMDVGGNTGALLNALLCKHPDIEGIIFDLPEVVDKLDLKNSKLKNK